MKPLEKVDYLDKEILMDSLLTQFLSLVRLGILNNAKEKGIKEVVEVLEKEKKIGLQITYFEKETVINDYAKVYYIHIGCYSYIRKRSRCLDILTKEIKLSEYLVPKYFSAITNDVDIMSSMLSLLSYVQLNNTEESYIAFEKNLTTFLNTGDLND